MGMDGIVQGECLECETGGLRIALGNVCHHNVSELC